MGETVFSLIKWLRERYDVVLALLLPVWLAVVWIAGTSLVGLMFEARQQLTKARVVEATPAPELLLVELDEVFAEHYDYPKETPKPYLAEVIRAVAAHEPRVIVLDYWFTNADLRAPGFDAIVEAVAEASETVRFVFPTRLLARPGGMSLLDVPPPSLRRHVLTGYAGLRGDPVLDQTLMTPVAGGSDVAPSFALAALAAWTFPEVVGEAQAFVDETADSAVVALPIDTWQAANELLAGIGENDPGAASGWEAVLARYGLEAAEARRYGINHRDHFGPGTRGVLASEDLLGGAVPPTYLDRQIRDRLVVVGSTYTSEDDTFGTPFGNRRGVLVHAATLHSLLAERPVRQTRWAGGLALALLVGLAAMALAWGLSPKRALLAGGLAVLAYLLVFIAVFLGADRMLPLAWPLVGGAAGLYLAHWQPVVKRVRRDGPPLDLTFHLALGDASPAVGSLSDTGQEVGLGLVLDRPIRIGATPLAGHAQGEVEEWSVLRAQHALADGAALAHGLAVVARNGATAAGQRAVGTALFAALGSGAIGEIYRTCRKTATKRLGVRRPLRLWLHLEDAALAAVPWAAAYDEAAGATLGASTDVTVLHRITAAQARPVHAPDGPTTIGLAHTAPTIDAARRLGLPMGDAGFDRAVFDAALRPLPDVLVLPLTSAQAAEGRGGVGAIHLLGHSLVCDGRACWLGERDGEATPLDAEAIAAWLGEHGTASVVAFDSVRPSSEPTDGAVPALAAQVASVSGCVVVVLPSVVEVAGRVVFWGAFYQHVEEGVAVAFGRATAALAKHDVGGAGLARVFVPTSPGIETGSTS